MACAGAWAWGRVPDLLRASGHGVVAPDLDLSAGQTPQSHAAAVAALVPDGRRLVLVGHSYGGMVVPALAERLAPRIDRLVVLDGFMPGDGDSAFSLRGPEIAAARRAEAAARGDGLWAPPPPGPGDPPWMDRLVPMPLSAFETPVAEPEAVRALPGVYIACSRSEMGEQADRARRRGWEIVEVDASHVLPLTRPQTCAKLLVAAAGRRR